MALSRLAVRTSVILALLGLGLGVVGTGLVGASIYLNFSRPSGSAEVLAQEPDCTDETECGPVQDSTRLQWEAGGEPTATSIHPSPVPAEAEDRQPPPTATIAAILPLAATITPGPVTPRTTIGEQIRVPMSPTPTFVKRLEEIDPTTSPAKPAGLTARTPAVPATVTPTSIVDTLAPSPEPSETFEPGVTTLEAGDASTSTAQVEPPPPAEVSGRAEITLPPAPGCPVTSSASFDLIPIEGQALRDHPADVHGDLNLALRGYIPSGETPGLVTYEGNTDGDAPQLAGLFEPNRLPQIQSTYRINDWVWDSSQCGGHPRGCPGPPANTFWPVTLISLATTPGETIYPPERGSQLYGGGYTTMVLYAEERRITLGYTRRNSVAAGYVVHLEEVCVNPNLVALYRAQLDAEGWNDTGRLPGLRNNQALGQALGGEIKVAIRDAGSFMDPRSQKDWWR